MATRACVDVSYAELNNVINGVAGGSGNYTGNPAADGDVIIVPAGAATWQTQLNISKNVLIQGAGLDQTLITDELSRLLNQPSLIRAVTNNSGPFRITGIGFLGGVTNVQNLTNGLIRITGIGSQVRVDHCAFEGLHGKSLQVEGFCLGVIDHNTFDTNGNNPLDIHHDTWDAHDFGHGAWADTPQWGTDQFLFIENNTFTDSGPKGAEIDSYDGARFVVRYNTLVNVRTVMHGSEATGRSAKQMEEYNNDFSITTSTNKTAGEIRGGSIVTHDNTWTGFSLGHLLQAYRTFKPSSHFGPADGETLWDKRAPNATGGLGYWATGTHSGANGATALTDANAAKTWWDNAGVAQVGAWATNRFVESGVCYLVRNITQEDPANFNQNHIWAISNTANTINLSNLTQNGQHQTWNTGDVYEIWKVTQAFDQPGMGKSDLLSGSGTFPAGTTPYSDPHQAQEACYSWNNTLDLSTVEPNILSGRDFNNTTTKPGYTPYTYPHPLTSGTGGVGSIVQIIAPDGADYGEVPIGTTFSKPVNVHNDGDMPFTVAGFTPPEGWTQTAGAPPPFVVTAGLTVGLAFGFTPSAARNYEGDIIFDTDAGSGVETLHVRGRGVPTGGGSDGTIDIFQAKYWSDPLELIDYADLDAAGQPLAAFKAGVIGADQLSPTAFSRKMAAVGGPGLLIQYVFPADLVTASALRFTQLLATVDVPGVKAGNYVVTSELMDAGGLYAGVAVAGIKDMVFFGIATTNRLKVYGWNGGGVTIPKSSRLNFRIFSNPP